MASRPSHTDTHDPPTGHEDRTCGGKHSYNHKAPSEVKPDHDVEQLSRELLIRRTSDMFPLGYLTLIAIIQGGAFIVVLQSTVSTMSQLHTLSACITVLGQAAISLASIIIVSYQYLWFTTIMRWTPTFLDTLIPYTLGIGEVVPGLLLRDSTQWWVSTCAFLIIGSAALLHTVLRSAKEVFPGQVPVHRLLQRLLIQLAFCCAIAALWSMGIAILIMLSIGPDWLYVAAPWAMLGIGIAMITLTERGLTITYKSYGVRRSWGRAHRQEPGAGHKHNAKDSNRTDSHGAAI